MKIYGLVFKENGKPYYFTSEELYNKGEKVVVETEKGLQLGIVETIEDNVNLDNIKPIIRKASDSDYEKFLKNIKDANKDIIEIKKIVENENLNMTIIDIAYSLDKKMLLINFISEERIDFRDLVKNLASKFHARIELHQIGIRDKAKIIGGIGICGRKLCCSSSICNLSSVNINMVKNQNIALNPTKINGCCGRLLCCFNYENDNYEEKRKYLPKIGQKIDYDGKKCEVVDLDILNMKVKVKIDDNQFEEIEFKNNEK